jgi:hypothetical protein
MVEGSQASKKARRARKGEGESMSYQQIEQLKKQLAAEQSERCEVCNTELSQCGPQGVDGEPSLDCLVCKLREQLTAEIEKSTRFEESWKDSCRRHEITVKQLAAAQQPLVDALVKLRDGTWHPKDDKHHSQERFINKALRLAKVQPRSTWVKEGK